MTRLALLLAVILVACGPSRIAPTDTVAVSPRFTTTQQEAILSAADEWRRATGGVVHLRMVISEDADEHRIVPASDLPHLGMTQSPGGAMGGHVTIQLDVAQIEAMAPESLGSVKQIALHELLHGFGDPEHQATGLMRAAVYPGDGPCVDALALKRFCEIEACRKAEVTCNK